MRKRIADIIIETLIEKGIVQCFAVVGGGAMHLDNAIGLNSNLKTVFNHHEQACSIAAESYARLTGNMAAVCVTSGPGATNVITGVMGAWQDSLPMIVLSGQVRNDISVESSGLPLRYRGVQEFEIIPTVKNMTKYAVKIKNPLNAKYELCKAIDIAMSGRRGPVWLDVPLDIQSAIVETDELLEYNEFIDLKESLSEVSIKHVYDKLKEAKRPVILAGNGIANSHCIEEFREFACKISIPVVGACIAADAMYSDYDKYYGLSGSIGPRTGNFIIHNADVILSLGCSLGFKMTGFNQEKFAPNAYIISVDIDENEMKKPGVKVDYYIKSELKHFFEKSKSLNSKIDVPVKWINYCNELKERFSPFDPGMDVSMDDRVCSYWFWKKYEENEPSDSITILGNNTANSAKLQIGVKKQNQRIIANNNCGSMGYDLPGAVGIGATGKDVICVTGDGSIMMNLQELQTIKHYNLPVKIIIFSNDGYNAIRQTSKNFFNGFLVGCDEGSGVSFPNFSSVAKTFGFDYKCCNNNGEVDKCLNWFFNTDKQVILEVMERLDDPVTPKVMSRKLEDGTMLSPALHDMYPFLSDEEMKHWMEIGSE